MVNVCPAIIEGDFGLDLCYQIVVEYLGHRPRDTRLWRGCLRSLWLPKSEVRLRGFRYSHLTLQIPHQRLFYREKLHLAHAGGHWPLWRRFWLRRRGQGVVFIQVWCRWRETAFCSCYRLSGFPRLFLNVYFLSWLDTGSLEDSQHSLIVFLLRKGHLPARESPCVKSTRRQLISRTSCFSQISHSQRSPSTRL